MMLDIWLQKTYPHFVGKPVENLVSPSQELLDFIEEFEPVSCLFHG